MVCLGSSDTQEAVHKSASNTEHMKRMLLPVLEKTAVYKEGLEVHSWSNHPSFFLPLNLLLSQVTTSDSLFTFTLQKAQYLHLLVKMVFTFKPLVCAFALFISFATAAPAPESGEKGKRGLGLGLGSVVRITAPDYNYNNGYGCTPATTTLYQNSMFAQVQ